MEKSNAQINASPVHQAEIDRLKKSLGDNVLLSSEREQVINDVFPIAQKLHGLVVKKAELEQEIAELRSVLSQLDLDSLGEQKFEFGEYGAVSVKKSAPKLSRSILSEKFSSLAETEKADLESHGFLSITEEIVPNHDLLKQLSKEELDRLIDKHKFLQRETCYRANTVKVTPKNEKVVENLLQTGVLEAGENAVRVQTVKAGRKTRWERRDK